MRIYFNSNVNKLASLEATLVRNSAHSLTHRDKCRATSVANKIFGPSHIKIHERWSWITFLRGSFAHFAKTTKWPPREFTLCHFPHGITLVWFCYWLFIVNVNAFPTNNISCSISFPLFQLTVIGVSCVNCPITWLIWWFMRPCNLYNS